jgi:hypothetical protein
MPKIFISYRREDSEHITGRIYDRLEQRFGHDNVYLDVDTIPLGVDFRKYLDQAVGQCDLVLVVIGRGWLDARYGAGKMQGKRRLEDPLDFVRIEVQSALARQIPVIPVLVGDAGMPGADELPEEMQDLAYMNAARVGAGADFKDHVLRLIRGIEHRARPGIKAAAEPASAEARPPESETKAAQPPEQPTGNANEKIEPQPDSGSSPGNQEVEITVPGTWYARPAADLKWQSLIVNAEWSAIQETPAKVSLQPGEAYRLKCDASASDQDLSGLTNVGGLGVLQTLELDCPQLTDGGLVFVGKLCGLRFLTLIQCMQVTDAGMANLGGLGGLEILRISGCKLITDDGLSFLDFLPGLKQLEVWYCDKITDAGLAHVRNLSGLQGLVLHGCRQIGDSGLANLRDLTELEYLNLASCDKVSDAGLTHLQLLTKLNTLDLSFTQVSNAGLAQLQGLSGLRYLHLSSCKQVKDVGLAALKKLLPKCSITR